MGFFDRDERHERSQRSQQWRDDERGGREDYRRPGPEEDERWGRGREEWQTRGRFGTERGYEGRGYEGGRFEGRHEGRYGMEGRGGEGRSGEGRWGEGRSGEGRYGMEGRYGEGRYGTEGRGSEEGRGFERPIQSWLGERAREGPSMRGRGPKGYKRSDERIKEDVCDVLMDHWAIDASDINVDVRDGVVTLTGTVGARAEKRLAEDVLENLSGVKEVNNQLRVHRAESGDGGTRRSAMGSPPMQKT